MFNSVQGVQGAVQGLVQGQSLTARGLCRVCRGFPYVTCARQKNTTPIKNKTSSRIYTPCTPCTPCTDHGYQHLTNFRTLHGTLHTLHNFLSLNPLKKIMKIICGKENVEAFNRELKAHTPAFHGLLKELHAAGMISGLRGVTLETGDFQQLPAPAAEQPKPEVEKHCEDCKLWVRDTIGSGVGIGECLIDSRPTLLKWPKQASCDKFEVKA